MRWIVDTAVAPRASCHRRSDRIKILAPFRLPDAGRPGNTLDPASWGEPNNDWSWWLPTRIPDDVVFTVEYSVRSAQEPVYSLLGLKRKPPAVYKRQYDLRVLYRAFMVLHDMDVRL
jgi:hypothetical protein